MPCIQLKTMVQAPVERVFDLSRSIVLHVDSTTGTGEKAVAGVTAGLIGPGEEVTWRAKHFGVWQTLTSKITGFARPGHFRDSMVRGAFHRLDHDHYFEPAGTGTLMTDVFDFASPFGWIGKVVDRVLLTRYLEGFLARRNAVIKAAAESELWRRYLERS